MIAKSRFIIDNKNIVRINPLYALFIINLKIGKQVKNIKLNSRQQNRFNQIKAVSDRSISDLIRLNHSSILNGTKLVFSSPNKVADAIQRSIIDFTHSIPVSVLDSMDTDNVDISALLNSVENTPRCAYCGSLTQRVQSKGSKGRWDATNLDHSLVSMEQFDSELSQLLNIASCGPTTGARAVHYGKGRDRCFNVVLSLLLGGASISRNF